jgi:predicted MFS family arabinose efflux permease
VNKENPASEAGEAGQPDGAVLVGPSNWQSGVTPNYRSFILVMMTLVYVVNYLDRQILGILMRQIKTEFHLSGLQVGVLSGPAFAIIYATLGIPVAILADRANRRNIVSASMAVFSLMTVVCGFAGNFWHLFLARVGTGIGEAGTGPSINSILADLYPAEKRASALSFYTAGLNVGLLIGFFGGGWVAQHYGWRHAFLAAGIPGLVLAIMVQFSVREPKRGMAENLKDTVVAPSLISVVKFLWDQKSFRWMSIGTAFSSFGGYAGITFIPLFLAYSHGMKEAEIGLVLSVLTGVFGAIGTYMAGVFADRFAKRDVRWNLYIPIIATFMAIPFAPLFYLVADKDIALAAGIVPALVAAAYVGPAYAMAQALVPIRMRARSVAILLFVLNFIGYGFGPPVVGKISDLLEPYVGTNSYRYAMLSGIVTGLIGAYCYWRSTATLKADLAKVSGAAA